MKILFAADMSFNYFDKFPGKERVKSLMAEATQVFGQADFSMLNLENIFGERENYTPMVKGGPNLISDAEFAEFLDVLKPTALGLANNHCRDYGPEALMDTMELLKEKGYMLAGAGKNIEEGYIPVVFEKDGIRVAVITICENEHGFASEDYAGSAGYHLTRLKEAINAARDRGEIPMVYFHGGTEHNPIASPGKVELYRHFIDIGAKAVIAMHTHCPQGYEMYQGCPIVYSMGNFFFPSGKSSREHKLWNFGYMTSLDVKADGISMEIIPYHFDFDHFTLLKGEEKAYFMKYMAYLNETLTDKKRTKEYFDAWSLIRAQWLLPILNFTPDMFELGAPAMKTIKNIFCCEAHYEVVRNALTIIYDGRMEEANQKRAAIETLQNYEIPK